MTTAANPQPAVAQPVDRLIRGVAALLPPYEVRSSVTIGAERAVDIVRIVTTEGSHSWVTSYGVTVESISVGSQTWERAVDQVWTEVDSLTEDPLHALADPQTAAVVNESGETLVLAAVYQDRQVLVRLESGSLRSVQYNASVDGESAEVVSTFTLLRHTVPITAPPGG